MFKLADPECDGSLPCQLKLLLGGFCPHREVETTKQFVLHGIAAGGAVPRRLYGI